MKTKSKRLALSRSEIRFHMHEIVPTARSFALKQYFDEKSLRMVPRDVNLFPNRIEDGNRRQPDF